MTRKAAPKPKAEKRPTGRPTIRTPEIVDEVIRRVSDGELLVDVLRGEGMPGKTTWGDWCRADETLSGRFARAREEGEDAIAADCLRIADDGSRDYTQDDEGRVLVDHDHIQRSKLRIDTRLKLLAKFNPRRWGERTTLAGDPEAPVQFAVVERRIVRPGD